MKMSIVCWSSLAMISAILAGCVGAEPGDLEGDNEASSQLDRSSEQAVTVSDTESRAAAQTEVPGAQIEPDSAVNCWGFSGYGSECQVRCSNTGWRTVGKYPWVDYGACTNVGSAYCANYGGWATGHCWN